MSLPPGLDVSAVREVHSFIAGCREEGKTVIFSSHSMDEAAKLCDRIGIIHRGRLADIGTIDGLKEKHGSDGLEDVFLRSAGGIE